ncbi:UDP-glucose/GDP-mannose dehydrogenase family protein [Cellulosimicrobium cellulans]|uniref:UDP-glucose dehydrogenase family protein n=1 Tax=Cellulosimicrobium cellulans TaxID=1710 RepID=UPI001EDA02E7|nr:UDP-glucose/GDP-mannose dehydrogenase family protein [Cellulosimicrobium cellulans]UKJ64678.1 UDP-glucose/GDP-mannose dehydrogenase family protein [Cellulosimicrobium cellulans]
MRISVIGCGYLGAVHAACMATLGHEVVGVDVDARKVASLRDGRAPFYEPGLDGLLAEARASGRLTFTTEPAAAADAEVHFVCVGTPQRADSYAADLSYVDAAFRSLVPHLAADAVVVGKSTVPVGTAARLADELAAARPTATLVWNPEFLREGFAVQDTLRPDRLVYGVPDDAAGARAVEALDAVYAAALGDGTPRLVVDRATAELVKVAANSFLATKISFINAMAELCEVAGGDVTLLADAIGLDERIGRRFLNAGLGFGGGCLPKDIRAFMARAEELHADPAVSFLREVDSINLRRRERMVDLTVGVLDGRPLAGARIAVLGAAFKPDSDDVRDSPALDVAERLHQRSARVVVTDPRALANARAKAPSLGFAETVEEAVDGVDAVLVLTEWQEYRELDPGKLYGLVAAPRVVDGRNALDATLWREAGWTYRALGRR